MGIPLLLDVDGAVSPLPEVRVDPSRARRVLMPAGYFASVFVYEDVAERLGRMHSNGIIDIQWNTSWEEGARDSLAPLLGWPEDLTTYTSREHRREAWWKAGPARVLWEAGEPFIWADDDLRRHAPRFILHGPRNSPEGSRWGDFGVDTIARTPQLLAISPRAHEGLTLEHLDTIEAFARAARA